MKGIILSFLLVCSSNIFSQNLDLIDTLYSKGRTAFESQNFIQSDSIFTEIIQLEPSKGAFFNRAFSRKNLGNMRGYCNDLKIAAYLYDSTAIKMVFEECTKTIVNYFNKENQLSSIENYDYRNEITIAKYDTIISIKKIKHDKKETILQSFAICNKKDTIWLEGAEMPDKKKLNVFEKGDTTFVGEEMPKFFNVESGLLKYMQTVVNYPHYAREVGTQGTVWLHFIINKKGYVDNLKVLSGIKDGLTEEAVRAIISMEKWSVGKKNGVPQDVKFTYPIRFKLQ